MKNRSLVSIDDFSTEEILRILDLAEEFEKEPTQKLLEGKVIATLFFEPSTRTRLSFESAINRLGGKIVGFSDASNSSVSKGETLNDTILTVNNYCDLIVMRHPIEGSARYASEIASVPVINAGDGANQHPTQTLLDLYSIRKTQGTLDNLNIFMVGDLKYGRTVHSLMMAMSRWNTTFNFISPEELKMPDEFKLYLDNLGLKYYEHNDFTDIISKADIIYMTRVQKERFSDPIEYEKVKNVYVLRNAMLKNTKPNMRILHPLPRVNEIHQDVDSNPKADIIYMTRVQKERFSDPIEYEKVKNVYVLRNAMLKNTKPNMRILHPLPRVNEIHQDVDSNPKAYYFEQALNGVYTRQAIVCSLLGIK